MKNSVIVVLLLFTGFDTIFLQAQPLLTPFDHIKVYENGRQLSHPWNGGFNNPQFSAADLNYDGIQDLVVFDASDNRFYTYLNGGSPGLVDYTYAPEYEHNFPLMHDIVLLRDYNCDGIQDMFAYSSAGLQVWKGYYDAQNHLNFQFINYRLTYPDGQYHINIYIDPVNLPAIVDVDGDGDLDIITFEQFGGTVAYFQNRSEELGYGCDSLLFIKKSNCWGEFCECSLWNNYITLNYSNSTCFYLPFSSGQGKEWITGWAEDTVTRHSGSTMTLFDQDKDGDMEALIGDVSFDNLVYLHNNNITNKDVMNSVDSSFPLYNIPVDMPVFPAAYILDVNNDQKEDMLISSFNINYCMLDPLIDTSANVENVLYYKNTSSDSTDLFQYQNDHFLIRGSIDAGENALPAFFDYNADGKMDLLIGNCYRYDREDTLNRGLSLYENTGTAGTPEYRLVTRDFQNFSALEIRALSPSFGDMDGDGDLDMLCGNIDGSFVYFENTAGATNPPFFSYVNSSYKNLNVGEYSKPQIVDVNRDGLPDIISGSRQGTVFYFKNIGTVSNPDFTLVSNFWGAVDVRDGGFFGFSTPVLYPYGPNQEYNLFVGSEKGKIFMYDSIEGNLNGNFHLVSNTLIDSLRSYRSAIDLADINHDGDFEMLIGSLRGGLSILSSGDTVMTGIHTTYLAHQSMTIYPVPAKDFISIQFSEKLQKPAELKILSISGRTLKTYPLKPGRKQFILSDLRLKNGIYFIECLINKTHYTQKLIILH